MTYSEIGFIGKTECGITSPVLRVTPMTLLHWISRARAILQRDTRVIKRRCAINLKVDSTDGGYGLPGSQKFHTISFLEYSPDGASPMADGSFRVPILPWDSFFNAVNTNVLNPQNISYSSATPNAQTASIIAGVNSPRHKIYLNPKNGFTGKLYVTYSPQLDLYGPESYADSEWKEFTGDPAVKMAETGLEPEFSDAEMGVIAYVKAQIATSIPDGLQKYGPLINGWMQEFEECKRGITREDTDYTQYQPPPVDLGGVF